MLSISTYVGESGELPVCSYTSWSECILNKEFEEKNHLYLKFLLKRVIVVAKNIHYKKRNKIIILNTRVNCNMNQEKLAFVEGVTNK